mmetsp:Transcript_15816/g.29238  ORF Transcript_15816/g.29238 Transcript_15816/m.29238 type:complete len:225 (+) Transcript_15816:188-862(+)
MWELTMRLDIFSAEGCNRHKRSASFMASGINSSGATNLFTKPSSLACSALSQSLRKNSSLALTIPTRYGSMNELPNSGVNPNFGKGYINLASEEQMTMSWHPAIAMLTAPPTVIPFTAEIEGFGKSQNALVSTAMTISLRSGAALRAFMSSIACLGMVTVGLPDRSAPALNARPLPVQITTLTFSSRVICSSSAIVSHRWLRLIGFMFLGVLYVQTATPAGCST